MKKRNSKLIFASISLLTSFVLWTILICFINVKPIGPNGSKVGLSSINGYIHNLLGVHMWLYTVTDWLGLVPIAFMFVFAVLGLIQWIKRKNLFKVDYDILVMGVYFVLILAVYILFEYLVINYRPVLINGYLEASYPSSTTMLCACVMPASICKIKNKFIRYIIGFFTAFMIICRLISGVHWFSDIVGGLLFSIGIFLLYYYVIKMES